MGSGVHPVGMAPTPVSVENALTPRKKHSLFRSYPASAGRHSQRHAQCAFSLNSSKIASFSGRQTLQTNSSSLVNHRHWAGLSQVKRWMSPAMAHTAAAMAAVTSASICSRPYPNRFFNHLLGLRRMKWLAIESPLMVAESINSFGLRIRGMRPGATQKLVTACIVLS